MVCQSILLLASSRPQITVFTSLLNVSFGIKQELLLVIESALVFREIKSSQKFIENKCFCRKTIYAFVFS